ncbi:MAG: tripartite tricarboxylate transporter substrate-binding protein, partial [Burkholderiaceae bacterium]
MDHRHAFPRRTFLGAIAALATVPRLGHAQAFPSRPIRLVIPFAPGGINDIVGRVIGRVLSEDLGQPVVVDNRPGASGTLGAAFVAKSPPDGYTLLVSSTGPIVMAPTLYKNLAYKPQQDLAPVSQLTANPTMLVVHPSVQATTLQELIALAKSAPGKLTFASVGPGTAPHLAAELFKSSAGIDMVH